MNEHPITYIEHNRRRCIKNLDLYIWYDMNTVVDGCSDFIRLSTMVMAWSLGKVQTLVISEMHRAC